MHHSNIRSFATETYKVQPGFSLLYLKEVFVEGDCNYNLRRNNFLNRQRVKSVRYCSLLFNCKILDILPKEIKDSEALNIREAKIKNLFNVNVLIEFLKHMNHK